MKTFDWTNTDVGLTVVISKIICFKCKFVSKNAQTEWLHTTSGSSLAKFYYEAKFLFRKKMK